MTTTSTPEGGLSLEKQAVRLIADLRAGRVPAPGVPINIVHHHLYKEWCANCHIIQCGKGTRHNAEQVMHCMMAFIMAGLLAPTAINAERAWVNSFLSEEHRLCD